MKIPNTKPEERAENITEKVKLILDKTNFYQSDVIVKMFVNLIYAEKAKARLREHEWIERALDIAPFFDEYENGKKIYDQIYELLTERYKSLEAK